ncbi:phage tail protein [Sandarakinorhabdus sp.]|uniref:phage tail protein n=1 Tax=Sandarakinorhabdus sp. TaxID=1916663 RepID=UPI00286E5FC0|nr:phage tail protein [Sandarakinorhabdus sp.]
MGKILKPLAVIAAIAVNVIPGAGQLISGGIIGALGGSFAAAAIASVAVPALLAATTLAGLSALGGGGRGAASSLVPFDPKSINPDPAALRKYLLGRGLFAMDLRHFEASGANQEYIDYVFCLAAHRSQSVDEIWIDKDLAWTAGGGVQGKYAGYLTIEVILEAGPGAFHTVNGGANWGSAQRLTGCTTMKARVKRSDNSKTSQSPFGSGIGGQWRVIGNGMPVYDPARDSTVAGGSGPQRANDCTTWAWEVSGVERGRNLALQLLSILLGWKINGVGSVGFDYPADTMNLAGWAQAAALCDEAVALNGGGSQRRYEGGGSFTDGDGALALIARYEDAVNGEFTDHGGQFNFRVAVNDLTPTFTLTDDDFVTGYEWQPQPPLGEQFTVVRARYTQPASPTLFDLLDVPEVAIPRTAKGPRPLTLDLSLVQETRRAQRIMKQVAQRQLIRGEFRVTLGIRGWRLRRNQVGVINSATRGWTGKLVRVRDISFSQDGTATVLLREEAASVFAWDREESPVVTAPTPAVFDTRAAASWLLAGIAPGADVTVDQPVVSRLSDSSGQALPSFVANTGNPFAQLVASGDARDGDVVNFPGTLPGVPRVFFLPGGKSVTADNIRISADGLSASGFTMVAKSQTVTAGSTITDTGSSAGGVGEPARVINRSSGSAPFDGRFTYRFSVTVGMVAFGEPGNAEVALFARIGGAWAEVGRESFNTTGTYNRSATPGAVDFGAGAEFGVSLVSSDGVGTALTGFTQVQYTPGTVVEASLTPANAGPIPWQAFL